MQLDKYMNIPSKTIAAALLIVSFAWFASPVKSEIIVIDNFSVRTQGAMIVDYHDTFDSQSVQTSGYIKGNAVSRDINLTSLLNTDEDGIDRSVARVSSSLFKWSNDSAVASTTTMNHEFAPIDVTSAFVQDGVSRGELLLDVTNVDLGVVTEVTLIDSNNNSATTSFSTSSSGAQTIKISYIDFLAVNSSLDFTNIKSVTTTLSGPAAVDMDMRTLAFSTPEPSSVMLFSLAGLGFASRRRRKRS